MVKRTIWKWSMERVDCQRLMMPRGAKILSVQMQHGAPQIWAYCDPTEKFERREFRIIGTGHDIPSHPGEHIATVQDRDFVWHVFESSRLRCTCPGGSPDGALGFHNDCKLHGLPARSSLPQEAQS